LFLFWGRRLEVPRSIWNGAISFGMVSMPVKLYPATHSKSIAFHLLHAEDNVRLRNLRWCPDHEREVSWDEVVRGYEYATDQYVVLTDDDFDRLPLPSRHTIDLLAFVAADEIRPVLHESSYYVEPDEMGARPFALLVRALQEKKLVGVGKMALRTRERVCALRPMDGGLVLETLLYADEVEAMPQTETLQAGVSDRELGMAFSLIDLLTDRFRPEEYHDEYRDALGKLIEAKLEGREVAVPTPAPAKVIDLMSALRASVEDARKRRLQPETSERPSSRREARAS
jgi:DNA end-binding protein Ku